MPYIKKNDNGKGKIKFQVLKDVAFFHLLNGDIPNETDLISDLFDKLDILVREREPSISREALSNVHGDWYEWLLAIVAWNSFVKNPNSHLAVLLPNVTQLDVSKLYESDLSDLIDDLRVKVGRAGDIDHLSPV